MKILVLGGTHFLGRHISETLIAHGHQLTLFNRGKTNPFLFSAVEEVHGDRYNDLSLLRGHSWDVVIDTCGYNPATVGRSAYFLKGFADLYVFVSSVSVYKDFSVPKIDEHAPTRDWPKDGDPEDQSSDTYGARKVLCEVAVEDTFGDRCLIVRPGLLAGPYDTHGRVVYWLDRIAKGGDVLAPGDPNQTIQLLDARDLALWILKMIEGRRCGTYNAVGPSRPLTFGDFLNACQQTVKQEARFVWASEPFLLKNKVVPWTEMPIWVPEFIRGLHEIKGIRAFSQGLICRPLESTLEDTHQWMQESKPSWPNQTWLTSEKEAQLLALLNK